jgi:hypothetical protein
MDLFLLILGAALCILGIIGSILPVLPGLPISWLGLLCLHFTSPVPFNYTHLGISFAITVLIFILDYIIPALGTKRFGGSKKGAIGTTIGLVIGIFIPIPFGILIGPFLGAFIGEFFFQKVDSKRALRAAFGSFLGFLASAFMEFLAACTFFGLFIFWAWDYWGT